jgi:hypothetical protein
MRIVGRYDDVIVKFDCLGISLTDIFMFLGEVVSMSNYSHVNIILSLSLLLLFCLFWTLGFFDRTDCWNMGETVIKKIGIYN